MKSAERQQRRGGGILHFLAVAERSKAKSFESKDATTTIYPEFLIIVNRYPTRDGCKKKMQNGNEILGSFGQ